jgi:hypothetical protein
MKNLITKRPAKMTYNEYRLQRIEQNKNLKNYLRGRIIYCSWKKITMLNTYKITKYPPAKVSIFNNKKFYLAWN